MISRADVVLYTYTKGGNNIKNNSKNTHQPIKEVGDGRDSINEFYSEIIRSFKEEEYITYYREEPLL